MKQLAKRIIGGATALAVLAVILGAVAVSDTGTAQAFSHGDRSSVLPTEPLPPECAYVLTTGNNARMNQGPVYVTVCRPPYGNAGVRPNPMSPNHGAVANGGAFARPGASPGGGGRGN